MVITRSLLIMSCCMTPKKKNDSSKTMQSQRASQEEQNGVNFSSVAPSSEELWVRKKFDQNA